MSKQTLKFSDIVVNNKKFYASKQAISLNSENTNNVVVSYRIKHNDDSYRCFIGYSHDDNIIRPLYIILPQMSGYVKYFDNVGKNVSFKIEDESLYLKYTEIWNKNKDILNVKFYSQPIYDNKYIKTKVKHSITWLIHFFQEKKSQKKELIMFVLQQFVLILY